MLLTERGCELYNQTLYFEWMILAELRATPMRRREFSALVGGAACSPFVARAQQPTMPLIGFLNIASPKTWGDSVAGFKQGLAQTGLVEGVNAPLNTGGHVVSTTAFRR